MTGWILSEVAVDGSGARLSGYAVHDALGMRLGYVTGWVRDSDGHIQMLKVAVTEWDGASDYLIPVGAITLVSDTRSLIQLRDVTKQSIGRLCYRYKGELPEPRLLISLQRHFKAPRVSVVERLNDASSEPSAEDSSLSWTRLSAMTPSSRGEA